MVETKLKLKKHRSRTVGDKDYFKWELIIPPEIINGLQWDEDFELDAKAKNGRLIIWKKE